MNYIIKGPVIRKGDRIMFPSEKFGTIFKIRKGEYPDILVRLDDGSNVIVGIEPLIFVRRGK